MVEVSNIWTTKIKKIVEQTTQRRAKRSTAKRHHYSQISIFTQFYPPDYAATGQLIQELATELARDRIKVNVFTGQPGYAFTKAEAPVREKHEFLQVRRSRFANLCPQRIRGKALNGVLFCLRSLLHLLKTRNKKDVLLVTTAPPFLPIVAYLAHLCFNRPYVCLVYDLYPDVVIELGVLPEKNPIVQLWHRLNRQVWEKAQSIIVLSSTMKERIVERHPQIADKISVVHNWANHHWIKPMPKSENWFAYKHNIVKKFTVLYSGNLGRCHDANTILRAIELLRNEPIQFVFIGGGAKQTECQEAIALKGLQNCLFLPYQEKQDLPYSLTSCDLALVSIASGLEGVVVPSKLYGILAAGRPVAAICEPRSYLCQLLAEAGCGETFNNNDSFALAAFIRYLSLKPMQAMQMGRAGRQYLEAHFTPEIIARKYAEVILRSPEQQVVYANYKHQAKIIRAQL